MVLIIVEFLMFKIDLRVLFVLNSLQFYSIHLLLIAVKQVLLLFNQCGMIVFIAEHLVGRVSVLGRDGVHITLIPQSFHFLFLFNLSENLILFLYHLHVLFLF